MTLEERATVLDIWLDVAPPTRLLAGCWVASDFDQAQQRGVAPIVVMRDLADRTAALAFLRSLPVGAYVYSHPAHSPVILDGELCAAVREAGFLPAGAKVAKVRPPELRAVRSATGESFALWDASSRNIAGSLAAGASGVVATPLSPFAPHTPPRDLDTLQPVLNAVQYELDGLGEAAARRDYLHALAASPLDPWVRSGGPKQNAR